MHAYPIYGMLARSPLDLDFVPFTCALTAALCGQPVLMEESGGCTAPPGRGSYVWRWLALPFKPARPYSAAGRNSLWPYRAFAQ